MKIEDLDYELPEGLIAQEPAGRRGGSRLLVLDRASGTIGHKRFADFPGYLGAGDCVVLNESKVIPARFFIRRQTGGVIEGLFLRIGDGGEWEVLLRSASRLRVNERVELIDPLEEKAKRSVEMTVMELIGQGRWRLRAESSAAVLTLLKRFGRTPLPPYIRRGRAEDREKSDRRRYQTVYAREAGSVAAPTAGLHFTKGMLGRLEKRGVQIARLTLHVGIGTFGAISTEAIEEHQMQSEWYSLDEANAGRINEARTKGGRVVAVGTTSVRTLETLTADGRVSGGSGETDLFIRPGYRFGAIDVILTNFHLPRTTLLALVCAFGGRENVLRAYREAIEAEYRFYSYGDAMLVV